MVHLSRPFLGRHGLGRLWSLTAGLSPTPASLIRRRAGLSRRYLGGGFGLGSSLLLTATGLSSCSVRWGCGLRFGAGVRREGRLRRLLRRALGVVLGGLSRRLLPARSLLARRVPIGGVCRRTNRSFGSL